MATRGSLAPPTIYRIHVVMSDIFRFRKAVVCCVPDSLPAAALRQDESIEPVNLEVARKQHKKYTDTLRKVRGWSYI